MSFTNRIVGFLNTVLSSKVQFAAGPRLLGRHTAGAGPGQEITLGTGLQLTGSTLSATSVIATSSGGEGATDFGKAALYLELGGLRATGSIDLVGEENLGFRIFAASFAGLQYSDGVDTDILFFPQFPSSRQWFLPSAGGTLLTGVTSSGGEGTSDSGKIPLFNANGGLSAAFSLSVFDEADVNTFAIMTASGNLAFGKAGKLMAIASPASFAANRSIVIPDVSGTIAVIPAYANLAAANAALNAGDGYWDTGLGRLRLATS